MNFMQTYKVVISIPNFNEYNKLATKWVPKEGAKLKDIRDKIEISGRDITFRGMINRNNFAETNIGDFQFYNLNRLTRTKLHQDRYDIHPQTSKYIEVYVGYQDNNTLVFAGYVRSCYSAKRGAEYITYIKAVDQSFILYRNMVAFSIGKGASEEQVLQKIKDEIGWVSVSKNYTKVIKRGISRGRVYFGDGADILNEYFVGNYFIENGVLHFKDSKGAVKEVPTAIISPERGLISTPIREGVTITLDMLFDPKLFIGQAVQLISNSTPLVNGIYSIAGLKHSIHISSREKGENITTLSLLTGFKR